MNTRFLLTLMNTPKISRKTVKKVLDVMDSEPASLQELHELLAIAKQKHGRIHLPALEDLEQASLEADRIATMAQRQEVKLLGYSDSDFPQKLKQIPDPPVLLYAKGNIECLNAGKSIAVIGTREPSQYGQRMAERFGAVFGEKGIVVVSGLALGCDTGAHQGCVNVKGKTVAVLANGLDTVYPAQNHDLAERILELSGCLVSEYPSGSRIMNNYFVDRDRLQSGLSDAVVVVETDIKGGTMHTVNFCIEQGRVLACLDHPDKFTSDKSNGNKQLIAEGKALPIKVQDDIDSLLDRISNSTVLEKTEADDTGRQLTLFD